jgi:tetratricopeptide (TPR) repeat protein
MEAAQDLAEMDKEWADKGLMDLRSALVTEEDVETRYEMEKALLQLTGKNMFILPEDFLKKGEIPPSVQHAKGPVAGDSNKAEKYFDLGQRYLLEGDQGQARGAYEDALRCDPDHAGANYNLGLIHRSNDNPAQAVRSFEKAAGIQGEE